MAENPGARMDSPASPALAPGLLKLSPYSLDGECIHLLAPSESERLQHSHRYRYRVISGKLPKGSFIKVNDDIAIPCPELLFVEMAERLSDLALVLLGFEMCGRYRYPCAGDNMDARGDDSYGFIMANGSLTSTERLASYVSALPSGMRGLPRAKRALRYIRDNSMSPAETMLVLRLSMPSQLGGYALPWPISNPPITLDSTSSAWAQRRSYRGDLVWEQQKVVLEYNGARDHSAPSDVEFDALRRNRIQRSGYTVITATKSQVANEMAFEELVGCICKELNMRHRRPPANRMWRKRALADALRREEQAVKFLCAPPRKHNATW